MILEKSRYVLVYNFQEFLDIITKIFSINDEYNCNAVFGVEKHAIKSHIIGVPRKNWKLSIVKR